LSKEILFFFRSNTDEVSSQQEKQFIEWVISYLKRKQFYWLFLFFFFYSNSIKQDDCQSNDQLSNSPLVLKIRRDSLTTLNSSLG